MFPFVSPVSCLPRGSPVESPSLLQWWVTKELKQVTSPEPSASIPATLGQAMGLFQTGPGPLNLQVFLPISLPYLKTCKNHAEIFVCMHIPAFISSSKSLLFTKYIHAPVLMRWEASEFPKEPFRGWIRHVEHWVGNRKYKKDKLDYISWYQRIKNQYKNVVNIAAEKPIIA